MKQLIHEEKTQTTCVLRLFGAPLWTVQQAAQQADIAARCRGRGAEVLAALQAETPAGLEKARKALNGRFAAELYGEGEMTLVHAAVQALETHRRLLVCCDADAGTLLEARLETVPGAEKVFDFGALSYADAKTREKLSARTCRVKGGPIPAKLARVQAAQRLVGADLAAGCVERAEDTVLFLGSRRGCWVRTVANTDAPALWLLDMIRRAAGGGDKLAKIRQGGPGGCADGADSAGQAGKHRSGKAAPQTAQGTECPDFSAGSGTGRVCCRVVLHRRRPDRPAPEIAEPWRRQPAPRGGKADLKKTPEGVNLPGFFVYKGDFLRDTVCCSEPIREKEPPENPWIFRRFK